MSWSADAGSGVFVALVVGFVDPSSGALVAWHPGGDDGLGGFGLGGFGVHGFVKPSFCVEPGRGVGDVLAVFGAGQPV